MSEITNENNNKRKSLGRGLGSLLGNPENLGNSATTKSIGSPAIAVAPQVQAVPPESRIWQVSVDKLRPSAFQPRSQFDKAKLEELAESIKANGILQPIVARKLLNGSFEIIAGERRWRAAQMAGKHDVPVILKTLADKETLELAIIENIQREDLNPIEEADAYQRLVDEFNMTQQQVAEKVGKERATVANSLRLLLLPLEVRDQIVTKEISVGHAKVLLGLQDPQLMKTWAKKIQGQKLTVRQLEKAIQSAQKTEKAENSNSLLKSNVTEQLIDGLSSEVQKLLGTKVQIDYKDGKGKLQIHFYSDDELSQIVERLREGCRKK